MRPFRTCGTLLLTCGTVLTASAQTSAPPPVDAALANTLSRLAGQAATLKTAIPSFECTETGVSTVTHGDKQKKRVTFTATIQAKRNAEGSLDETFRVHMLDGQPYDKERANLPLYIEGGFSNALSSFATARQACFNFSLSPGRLDFAAKPTIASIAGCRPTVGLVGFALLDTDGEVTHIERRVPKDSAYKTRYVTYSATELRPVQLNGQTYRLTSAVTGELPSGDDLLHFEATYSVCHRFATSVTIGPASQLPPDELDAPAPK